MALKKTKQQRIADLIAQLAGDVKDHMFQNYYSNEVDLDDHLAILKRIKRQAQIEGNSDATLPLFAEKAANESDTEG